MREVYLSSVFEIIQKAVEEGRTVLDLSNIKIVTYRSLRVPVSHRPESYRSRRYQWEQDYERPQYTTQWFKVDVRFPIKKVITKLTRSNSIKVLNLENLGLNFLPPEIGNLSNLTSLNLSNNNLTSLPPEASLLKKIFTKIYWGKSNSFPHEIINLVNLVDLDLSYNNISWLVPEICQLENLKYLNLRHNKLQYIPSQINQLVNLGFLDLRDNLLPIPPEILVKTNQPRVILDYYFNQRKKLLSEAKLVFIGCVTAPGRARARVLLSSAYP